MVGQSLKVYLKANLFYFAVVTIIYLVIQFLHFRIFTDSIVLYSLLADAILSILVCGLGLVLFYKQFETTTWINAMIIFLLSSTLYATLGPTMCDRSLSTFLLLEVRDANERGEVLTSEKLVHLVDEKYVMKDHMVMKRLREYEKSGVVRTEQGAITMTPRGRFIAGIFDFFYKFLNLQRKF
jgi:hypothetical protein